MPALFALILTLFLVAGSAAQDTAPLKGPLLASTSGAQDAVQLIETATGTIRTWSLGAGVHTAWDFSPDGCHLLITVSGGDGLPRLYITTLSGQIVREPVQYDGLPAGMWGVWEPDWSPDGARIAFRMMRDGFDGQPQRQYHVAWVAPEGGPPEFYSVSGREHSPRWSPDGQWLAYVSYDRRAAGADAKSTAEPEVEAATAPEDFIQEADLWVVSADGSLKARRTAYVTGSVRAPRWSPDGRFIAYTFSPSPSNDTFWVVENVASATPVQVTYGYGLALDQTWTPDGGLLVSARGLGGQTSHDLWQIPVRGGADALMQRYTAQANLPYPDYPAYSPDSRHIALRSGYRATLIDTQTGGVTVFDGAHGNMPLIWSPSRFTDEALCTPTTT